MPIYVSPRASVSETRTDLTEATAANDLASLDGITVGLFNNSKPNTALLVDEVASAIGTRVSLGELLRISKPLPTEPAEDSLYDTLAERCGAVIFSAAD